jgi:hypothetical protein
MPCKRFCRPTLYAGTALPCKRAESALQALTMGVSLPTLAHAPRCAIGGAFLCPIAAGLCRCAQSVPNRAPLALRSHPLPLSHECPRDFDRSGARPVRMYSIEAGPVVAGRRVLPASPLTGAGGARPLARDGISKT